MDFRKENGRTYHRLSDGSKLKAERGVTNLLLTTLPQSILDRMMR